ncbi:exportin-4-like isoform X1 [Argopecten irradians]|uniref:exportin-4-like isoform X1 n=1 Tax=Argopecten irradians TaxID=31199 RepID=UPI0037227C45
MEDRIVQELEQVTQIVLAPPNIVTSDARHAAENVILEFRKTKMPYKLCRYILENSKCDYVLFQAATTIKEGVIREWSLLSSEDVESLRSFLLRFITQNITIQSYVREQILQTVAVILKRGTLEDLKGNSRNSLFQDVTQLVSSGNVTMQLVACSMLTALLNEYSSSSRTSSVGFTWEFHTRCKRAFEESDLKRVLLFALQVLNELEKQPSPLPREAMAVLNRMLSISEQVLCWEFVPKAARRHVGSFDMSQNIPLKPNEKWRDTLMDKTVLILFFKIHRKVRHNSEMAHHSMQCLTQLASLNGNIFADDKARCEYLATFIDGFLQLISSIGLQDYENLGVANIFKNLVMQFPMASLFALPEKMFEQFIEELTRLSCTMGQGAALEEAYHKDDTIHMEAYEKMLETWMELITKMKDVSLDKLKPQTQQVFNSYIQCHISAPDGTRTREGVDLVSDEDEIDSVEEDDRERFADQLCSIGIFGRMVPGHSIPSLCRLLEDRVARLHGQLQRLQHQQQSHTQPPPMDPHLTMLYEDIHWIILVTTYVLTEDSEGETPMIPSDIMEYSISQSKTVDIPTTLKVLASPGERADSIPGADQSTDFVVRLISSVLRLCEVEKRALQAKMVSSLSPQVSSSVMWFLRRWSQCYLLPDENYYSQTPKLSYTGKVNPLGPCVSPAILSAFGRDSEGAQWTVQFLLEKIISNLSCWLGEEGVLEDTLSLLNTMVDNRIRANYVSKCNLLWTLAKQEAEHKPPLSLLPFSCKRMLLRSLVQAGSGVEDSWKDQYWACVLTSIHTRFYETVCHEHFVKLSYVADMKERIIDLLECLCGIAQGTRIDNMERIFNFFHPLMADSVKLLDVYHGYEDVVQLVIKFFSEAVQAMLCYLGERDSKKMYELCLSLTETYSKHNIGKRIIDASDEEEDRYNDIMLVMEMLTNLLSKDFIDFSDPDEDALPGDKVEASDVALYGLNTVIPLMNADLLKYPTLCSQYFKLVAFLAELHPEKFASIPEDMFKNLVASVDLGFSSYGSDITKLSIEIVTELASYVYQENQIGTKIHSTLSHFLKSVFNMLFLETFNMDLLETASTGLFCLICCHQEQYRELVNQLLQAQTDPTYKQRLLEAFNNLTPPTLTMTINRQSKIAFMHNFDQFLTNVRGFLCVK